jgi:thiol-disulfide isomerase/thioredoxin
MTLPLFAVLLVCATAAQAPPPAAAPPAAAVPPAAAPEDPAAKAAREELTALRRSLADAGTSPKDFTRSLEEHLANYPNTTHRPEIERALAKAAVEEHDGARIIKYGTAVLARDSSDMQLMESVARSYLATEDAASVEKGLEYAKKYAAAVENFRRQPPPGRLSPGQWSDDLDQALARSLALQARAAGLLGRKAEAVELARKGYETFPSADGAREWGRWLASTGDAADAIQHYADAFTMEDAHSTELDRAKDRRKLGELYTRLNGSEKGLGDLILAAYDRTSSLVTDHLAKLKSLDPNTQASGILDFTLPGVNGHDLPLATLKNKTVVLDFWATWCGPCKMQRPLYEEVEKKFGNRPDVVFISVNTDEERALVPPFVVAQKWTKPVYFDGGLADFVKISSIPTTLIVGKNGQIASRMNGFVPERFVDLLTERIEETLR